MLNEVFDKEAFEKSKEEIRELCNRFDANLDLLTLLNSKVLTFRYRSIGKKKKLEIIVMNIFLLV